MKIYVDTTIMQIITLDILNDIIDAGNKLCFTNTIVDIKVIRQNPEWLEKQLKAGNVFIECWSSADKATPAACLDEMVSKPFFWTSFNVETSPCTSWEAVYEQLDADYYLKRDTDIFSEDHSKYYQFHLDNWMHVDKIASLVIEYGLAKGSWPMGKWSKPIPISKNDAKALRVSKNATRTDILKAAKINGKWNHYSVYNAGYCKGLAMQHCCQAILNATGSITVIPNE